MQKKKDIYDLKEELYELIDNTKDECIQEIFKINIEDIIDGKIEKIIYSRIDKIFSHIDNITNQLEDPIELHSTCEVLQGDLDDYKKIIKKIHNGKIDKEKGLSLLFEKMEIDE